MPFIVRCPNSGCHKYNLVEDDRRGKTVDCLVCGTTMRVDSETIGSAKGLGKAEPPPQQPLIRTCPSCQARLRVPATADGQRVKCPSCSHVF